MREREREKSEMHTRLSSSSSAWASRGIHSVCGQPPSLLRFPPLFAFLLPPQQAPETFSIQNEQYTLTWVFHFLRQKDKIVWGLHMALLDNNRSCYLFTQMNQTQSKLLAQPFFVVVLFLFCFFGFILFNNLLLTIGPCYLGSVKSKKKKKNRNFSCIVWEAKTND